MRVTPSLAGGLGGARDWMRRYPYSCLEQRVSRAVALGDDEAWTEIVRALPAYQDRDGLLKYFPTMEDGSDVLTAYVVSLADSAGRSIPGDVLSSILDGLAGFVDGKVKRASRMADLPLRKLAALDALARHAKATPAQLAALDVEPALWPTSARARLVERAAPHARCSRPGGAPGGSRAAGARPARPLRDDAALLVRVAGRSLVADDRAGRERGAPRAAAPRFRRMARRPAPARARRARAPARGALGNHDRQRLGHARGRALRRRVRGRGAGHGNDDGGARWPARGARVGEGSRRRARSTSHGRRQRPT